MSLDNEWGCRYLSETLDFEMGCVKGGRKYGAKRRRGGQRERGLSASHLVMAGFEEARLDERKIWK
jgi:hypothetical protein